MKLYVFKEVISVVDGLDEARLRHLVGAQIIHPVQQDGNDMLRESDIARLRLCCELGDTFDLHGDALGLVMDLVDEMHGLRGEMRTVMSALEEESEDLRSRLRSRIATHRR